MKYKIESSYELKYIKLMWFMIGMLVGFVLAILRMIIYNIIGL